jgi:putative ABC transport system substrate-binding protein
MPLASRSSGAILALALVCFPVLARAADVALLKSSDQAGWKPAIDALRKTASSHTVTEHDLAGDRAEGDRVIASVAGKTALLVAMGPMAAQLAREKAPDLPLVFCMVQDPAKAGLLGIANVAGVAFNIPVKNQLAAFRMVNPRAARIGVVYNAENVGRLVQEAQKSAGVVRLILVERAVASDKEVPQALRSLLKGDDEVQAVWIPPDPVLLGDDARRFILSESLKAGKPVYTFSGQLVGEGAFVSDGPDYASIGEQAGELVNRLLGAEKGAKIEMLIPKAELVINEKIAQRLKIEIPADARRLASKVY